MINFVIWLILGGLAGWIASMIMGTNKQQSAMMDVVMGIVGAFVGGFLGNLLGIGASIRDGFSLVGLITAVVGAVIVTYVAGLLRKS